MSFHDVRFPLSVAYGTAGGPMRRVDVVTLASGREERNALWAGSRRRYEAGLGLRSDDDLHAVIEFFEARGGKLHAFRFRDWLDWKSCPPLATPAMTDQLVGLGDGERRQFPLVKRYVSGGQAHVRPITKPVVGSVIVAMNGDAVAATVDHDTGLVSFAVPPAGGAAITAGFEFDTPVRFDIDHLSLSLADFRAGQAPSIPLIEVLP
ncbi:phage distal tail protein, Rcc01695 family [Zavarzinia sp.]|uniref:phage distal tail protein, Rcc01695 family n=1 Tax=Zavarzinia sp. TaxID=2027920 RepID=UPI003BB696C8